MNFKIFKRILLEAFCELNELIDKKSISEEQKCIAIVSNEDGVQLLINNLILQTSIKLDVLSPFGVTLLDCEEVINVLNKIKTDRVSVCVKGDVTVIEEVDVGFIKKDADSYSLKNKDFNKFGLISFDNFNNSFVLTKSDLYIAKELSECSAKSNNQKSAPLLSNYVFDIEDNKLCIVRTDCLSLGYFFKEAKGENASLFIPIDLLNFVQKYFNNKITFYYFKSQDFFKLYITDGKLNIITILKNNKVPSFRGIMNCDFNENFNIFLKDINALLIDKNNQNISILKDGSITGDADDSKIIKTENTLKRNFLIKTERLKCLLKNKEKIINVQYAINTNALKLNMTGFNLIVSTFPKEEK